MKKYYKKIVLIIALIIGSSYFYLQMYVDTTHLSDDDLEWMVAYNKNDTIYYMKDTNLDIDTLIVVDVYINNKRKMFNSYPFSFRSEYQANEGYSFIIKHNNKTDETNSFSISKIYENTPCFIDWNILGLISNLDTIFDKRDDHVGIISGLRMDIQPYNISDNEFNDCIKADLSNSHEYNYKIPMHIKEFIWSKKYGLLQYKTEEATYTRVDINNL